MWRERALNAQATQARVALEQLGGLMVMDTQREHVASLNLTTLPKATDLPAAMAAAVQLRHLQILDLTRQAITEEQLSGLPRLKRLNSLHMSETPLDNAGMEHVSGCRGVESLYVAQTNITDEGLSSLARMSQLTVLDLSGNALTGDLAPLQQLAKLQWLVARNIPFSPAALKTLGSMHQLKRLTVEEGQLDDAATAALKAAHPQLSIQ